jgi:hypothetical protein
MNRDISVSLSNNQLSSPFEDLNEWLKFILEHSKTFKKKFGFGVNKKKTDYYPPTKPKFPGFCGDYPGSDLRKMMRRKMFERIRLGEWPSQRQPAFSRKSVSAIMSRQIDTRSLDDQRISEWSKEFEELMLSRLLGKVNRCYGWYRKITEIMKARLRLGGMRYGWLGSPNKPQYDRLKDIESNRLVVFRRCCDPRLLADVANFCLLEFVEGDHPSRYLPDSNKKGNVKHLNSLTKLISSSTLDKRLDLIPMMVDQFKLSQNLTILVDIAAIAILVSQECDWRTENLPVDDESDHTDIRIQI